MDFSFMVFVLVLLVVTPCFDAESSYEASQRLLSEKLASNKYDVDIVPVGNTSNPLIVQVALGIVSIIEINDVAQKFVINGFLSVSWRDELLTWDPGDYENVYYIAPAPKRIWRPRMLFMNTLDKRDLFADDASPLTVEYTGEAMWNPGSVFPSSCDLDLRKYPFDKQSCQIQVCPMTHPKEHLRFQTLLDQVDLTFFVPNDEWALESTQAEAFQIYVQGVDLTCVYFQFNLKRRPTFFIVNIVLPVVLLSLLNMLVFTIPVESGEKISYGITVLLALTVYMSQISDRVPRSSDQFPAASIYLCVLLILSVLSVIVTIISFIIHQKGEIEAKKNKPKNRFADVVNKINSARLALHHDGPENGRVKWNPLFARGVTPQSSNHINFSGRSLETSSKSSASACEDESNRYEKIENYINRASFFVFILSWLVATVLYFVLVLA